MAGLNQHIKRIIQGLTSLLSWTAHQGGKLAGGFFSLRDWNIKLICLLLSIGLYFYVLNEDQAEKRINVPLEVINKPQNMALTSNIPNYVRVQLNGPKEIIARTTRNSLRAVVDLLSAQLHEEQTFTIKMERRDLAEGVTIEEYSPKKLKLRLEEVSQKEIQVIPRVVGSPPEGYERGKVRVKPEFVTIRGAQSLLADISQVYLSAINIDGRKKSVRQRAKLLLKDAIHSQIKSAYVYIPIVKSSAIQTYEIPIVVEGVVDLDTRLGYRLSHKTTTVRLRVPAKLSDFRRTDIKAWIDISGTGIGPNGKIFPSKMDTQNISIKLPTDKEGLELLGTTPDKVTIQYYKKRHLLNKENQGDGDSKSVQGKKNNKGQDKSEGKKNENKGGQDKGKAKPSQKEPTRDKPTSNNGTSAKSSANESPQKGRRGDTVKAGQDKEGKRDRNKKKLPKNGGEQKPASKQGSN